MPTEKRKVSGGAEWRLETEHGPVYVFQPDGYAGQGTVLYVHGYYDNADAAWKKQRLPEQFVASGVRALFIVPEAPIGRTDPVKWPSLGALLDRVAVMTGVVPADPVIAIGHSGAYETLHKWLSEPRLVHITMLDALYAHTSAFRDWANRAGHTMTLLTTRSGAPRINADSIFSSLFSAVKRTGVPKDASGLTAAEKGAKTLYVVADQSHMQLVEPQPGPITSWVIPVLLKRTPVAGGSLGLILLLAGAFVGAALLR